MKGVEAVDEYVKMRDLKVFDERFTRDKERLEGMESIQRDMVNIQTTLVTLVQNQEKQISKHDTRIEAVEKRPNKWVDKVMMAFISAVISGLVALLVNAGFGG